MSDMKAIKGGERMSQISDDQSRRIHSVDARSWLASLGSRIAHGPDIT